MYVYTYIYNRSFIICLSFKLSSSPAFIIHRRSAVQSRKHTAAASPDPHLLGSDLKSIIMTEASSSSRWHWNYDVFISFRGENTRYGFTGNLNNALKKAGVRVFFDDEAIKKGDEITPKLINAIENSEMAIIVFSKNYADSRFCLNELVKINECIRRNGRTVLPIFYDVDPSEVRHQKDKYGQDLDMHMNTGRADEDKIQSWKLALHEVANISGEHILPSENVYEYKRIESIVEYISRLIERVPLHVAEHPVGLESRVKKVTSLLQSGSNDKAIMVGIFGMGGLGKSTIARALYNSIARDFDGSCFINEVKGNPLTKIQETILSDILGVGIKIQDVNKGVEIIKMRLKCKKILLILDDVDEGEQLRKLAGECNWFGDGSRIIITTRDEHLLVSHEVESRYNVEAFDDEEALELLTRSAFKNQQVDPSFKDVLNRALSYAQGLPLALKVIGSNLRGKPLQDWESALDRYKLIPNKKIQEVLKVSYEALEDLEKEIFLDIACFFRWGRLKYVKYVLKAVYGFDDLSYSLGVLKDKCLIDIRNDDGFVQMHECLIDIRNDDGLVQMHDLIRDMGREKVREESPNDPRERSRLWSHQDIVAVLEDNTEGRDKIKMIVQDNWSECIEVDGDGEAFKRMTQLKMLIFENVKFSEVPRYIPNSLQVLIWKGYPSSCLPPNFSVKKLVVLDIEDSYLSSLEMITKASNLGILNLSFCERVAKLPDMSSLMNLKELQLGNCMNLIEIHDSIGYLPKLEVLDVYCCVQLKTFPRAIKLPSLTRLNLACCLNLKHFPEILVKVKLRELNLCSIGIEKLPCSICNLSELRRLMIDNNEQVIEIPSSIFLLPNIEELAVYPDRRKILCNWKQSQQGETWSQQCPNAVSFALERCNISDDILRTQQCPNTVSFALERCNISDDILRTHISRFKNVKHLNLPGNDFTILPAWIKECHFLKELNLNGCKHLKEVEGIPPNIRHLDMRNCVSLSSKSKNLLLSKEFHGALGRYGNDFSTGDKNFSFWVPSRSIPEWFDHSSKGGSISFWFRNSLPPVLCICLLVKPSSVVRGSEMSVTINHGPKFSSNYSWGFDPTSLNEDHLLAHHLRVYNEVIDGFDLEEEAWHHAQLCLDSFGSAQNRPMEEIGMYVIKQLADMQHISFIDPTLLDHLS